MSNVTAYLYGLLFTVQGRFEDRKERGATAVEYGLMVGLIAVVIIVAVTLLGSNLKALFNSIAGSLPGAPAAPPA
jgi:pilus assembly protein Flp/PilA